MTSVFVTRLGAPAEASCSKVLAAAPTHAAPLNLYLQKTKLEASPLRYDLYYYWDNWVVWDESSKLYHRYAQAAPRAVGTKENAHHAVAEIRHLVSEDGKEWMDLGRALGSDKPNKLAYWSGSVLVHKGEFYLFHTRANPETGFQYIALAVSKDGHNFVEMQEPALLPEERFDYDFSQDDGIIQAWRDPHIIWDERNEAWLMVFAAKTSFDESEPVAAVGRAYSKDLIHWELAPAMEIPRYAGVQIELPAIIETAENSYELVFNMVEPQTRASWIFRYRANSPSGVFIESRDPASGNVAAPFYGAHIFRKADGQLAMVGFTTEAHEKPLRLTEIEGFPPQGDTIQLQTIAEGVK